MNNKIIIFCISLFFILIAAFCSPLLLMGLDDAVSDAGGAVLNETADGLSAVETTLQPAEKESAEQPVSEFTAEPPAGLEPPLITEDTATEEIKTEEITTEEIKIKAEEITAVTVTAPPPTASIRSISIFKGQSVKALDFIYNIKNSVPVSVRYRNTPDFTVTGTREVYIILEDLNGKTTEYKTELTITADTTPPVISGVKDKTVTAGGTVSYREGVSVTDDCDPNVQLNVDSSAVNLNAAGVYTVVYSAADASGNKTEVRSTITVENVDMALVNRLADDILAKIIKNNMSKKEKAKAIYDWVNNRMTYSTRNPVREPVQGAYGAFVRGAGDCYTYMSASRVLLTRAGIENLTLSRQGGTTEHYWNLVNTGEGWYHFDVTPTPGNLITSSRRFMFTETRAEQFTEILAGSRPNYYVYDKSAVPETVR